MAHRLNTIRDVDMILVLKNGAVDEFNRFDALVNREGSVLSDVARVENLKHKVTITKAVAFCSVYEHCCFINQYMVQEDIKLMISACRKIA